jgi:hypothetical protein
MLPPMGDVDAMAPTVRPVTAAHWAAMAFASLCGGLLIVGATSAGDVHLARPTATRRPTTAVSNVHPMQGGTHPQRPIPLRASPPRPASSNPAAVPNVPRLASTLKAWGGLVAVMTLAAVAWSALRQWGSMATAPATLAAAAVVGIAADRSVKQLLEKHCFAIEELARRTADVRDPEQYDNIWLMRFAAANSDNLDAAEKDIRSTIAWRAGEGKYIVEAATKAIDEATQKGPGEWRNAPILAAAPYSSVVSKYITPSQILTISLQDTQGSPDTNDNDLVYVIRASAIQDKELMAELTKEQCVQFFLYAKEVIFQVVDRRTRQSGRLVTVITANDLSGINIFGDATFRRVLSEASKRAVTLYPLLAGPTLLLNLPRVLASLIRVFKPLFPKSVQEKLKFEQGPLRDVGDLRELLDPGNRDKFLAEIQTLLL